MRAWVLVAVAAMLAGCGGGESGLGLDGSGGAGGGGDTVCPAPTACEDAACPSGQGVPIYSCDPSCANSGPDYCEHACSSLRQIEIPKTSGDSGSAILHVDAMDAPVRDCAECGNDCGSLWWSARIHVPSGPWCMTATGPRDGLTLRADDGDECRAEPAFGGRATLSGTSDATVIVGLSGPHPSSWIAIGLRFGTTDCMNAGAPNTCNGAP